MYLFVAFMTLLVWYVIDTMLARRERSKLLDRLMARDYREYMYYDRKYPHDLKELELMRAEDRQLRAESPYREQTLEEEVPAEVKRFLDSTESDWKADEVDIEKIKEVIHGKSDFEENRE